MRTRLRSPITRWTLFIVGVVLLQKRRSLAVEMLYIVGSGTFHHVEAFCAA